MHVPSTLIVIFAKAPRAGRAKTRLVPAIGPEAAARLHLRMIERTVATALSAACGPVEIHGAPATDAMLGALARRKKVVLRSQAPGDIGQRMDAAFRQGLRRHARMILVGSDCPVLGPRDFWRAARLLPGCDAVLAPAEDGGYPLIGLSRPCAALFERIDWSTPSVMEQTRQRLIALGWRWRELRTLWDVDRPEDLARLHATGVLRRRL
jgi:uncharacterized protein